MKNFICFLKMSAKLRFTAILSFILLFFSIALFDACQKEEINSSYNGGNKNAITKQSAQNWFEDHYGTTNFVSPSTRLTPTTNDTAKYSDKFFLNETFNITPLWSNAEISTYLKTNTIVVVPVEPIPFLDSKEMNYLLVCFKDSLGNIDARLQVYRPTGHYKATHNQISVNDFSGLFYQLGMDGRVQKIFAIENGKFVKRAYLNANIKSNNFDGTGGGGCGCWDGGPGAGFLDEIWCMLTCAANTVAEFFITQPGDSSGGGGNLDYGYNPGLGTINTGGTGNPDGTNTFGGSNSGNSGASGNSGDGSLSNELDNSFFGANGGINQEAIDKANAKARYLNIGFTLIEFNQLWANQTLFTQVDGFYTTFSNSIQNGNIEDLRNGIDPNEYIDFYSEAIYLRAKNPSWSNSRVILQAFWNTKIGQLHTALDVCGLVPVGGEPCDLVNGVFYTVEGDGVNATISFASTVPVVGWAATLSKYAVKTIGTSGRTYKLLYKATNGIIEFGDKNVLRTQLRKILNLSPNDGMRAHHIIPLEITHDVNIALKESKIIQKAANYKAAFHPNEFNNGIAISEAFHFGSHPNYTTRVKNELIKIFDAHGGDAMTPQKAHYEIQELLKRIRRAIDSNPTTNINDIVF